MARGDVHPVLCYTIPVHHNPAGVTLAPDRRRRLVQLATEYNFHILADEVYQLLSFPAKSTPSADTTSDPSLPLGDSVPPPLVYTDGAEARVISMGSFSKILAPGLRLGWLHIRSPSLMERVVRYGQIVSGGGMNPLVCGIVHTCIQNGGLARYATQLLGDDERHTRLSSVSMHEHAGSRLPVTGS